VLFGICQSTVAAYTEVSLDDAEAIARAFSLVGVTAVTPVPAGTVNSNYLVAVGGTELFLRVYEEAGVDGARYEALLAAHLAARGVPTPVPLRTRAGGFCASHAGKPVALFPKVGGEEVCQARVTPPRARAVGALVARIHQAAADFPDLRAGRFTPADVVARLDRVLRPDLASAVARLREAAARLERARDPTLPRGTVHGDLFRDNVRWQGDSVVAVLDFESASEGVLAYDLAVAVLAWCYGDRFDPALVAATIEGYDSVRPLSARERAGLAAEAGLACVRFATTRLTDVEQRTPAGPSRKDYRRFLRRLDEVSEAFGPPVLY
jgi:homoserine kinase type II